MILKFIMMNIETFYFEKERIFEEEVKYPLTPHPQKVKAYLRGKKLVKYMQESPNK